jgi:hypothetical protein
MGATEWPFWGLIERFFSSWNYDWGDEIVSERRAVGTGLWLALMLGGKMRMGGG